MSTGTLAYPSVVKVVRMLLQHAPARRPSAAALLAKEPFRGMLDSAGLVTPACNAALRVEPAKQLSAQEAVPISVSARSRFVSDTLPRAKQFSARAELASRILEAEAQDRLAQQVWADSDLRLLGVAEDARRSVPEKRHGSKLPGHKSVDAITMATDVQRKADVAHGPPTVLPCPQGARKTASGIRARPRPQALATGRRSMSEAALPAASCYEPPLEVEKHPGLSTRREQRDKQRQEFLSWMRSNRRQRRQVNDEQDKCKDNGLTAPVGVECFEVGAVRQLHATPEAEIDVAAPPGHSTSMGEHLEKLRASFEKRMGTQRFRTLYQSMLEAENAAVCPPQMDRKEAHAIAGLVERDRLFFHVGIEVQAL
mmetsp:Transcript_34690/g.68444  ORF Transcript_34690/g.68444 Transcript_34690/m.68444 type:complete len:369 (+) Transcript_34690:438-1544(+)